MSNPILDAALALAALGKPIFPCRNTPDDLKTHKAPHTKNGFKDATTDPEIIKRWWTRWPDALIGMPTGAVSGISVLDLDMKKGKNGFAAVPDWKTRSPVIARTQSGGAHLYFKADGAPHCTTDNIALGVDTKGEGGYVIVPPSPGYQWDNGYDFSALPPWPDDLRPPARNADAAPGDNPETDPALVDAAMSVIPNNNLGWDEWNKIGMAVWRATGGSGFAAFDTWSQKSTKYDGAETARRWNQYFKSPPNKIGAGTLFFMANEASPGWDKAYFDELEATINNRGDYKPRAQAAEPKPPKAEEKSQSNKSSSPKLFPLVVEIAVKLWGEPTECTQTEYRFRGGTKGLILRSGNWYDFETNKYGGLRDLMQMAASIADAPQNILPLIDIAKWANEPVPVQEWAVPDRIPINKTTLFSGEGAAGKSLLQLQLSVAHVLGADWLGVVPSQGPALFIDAEDDMGVLHRRLDDILQHYGASYGDVKDKLYLVSLVGEDTLLGTFSRSRSKIEPTILYKRLLEMAGDLKPKIIGIASSADVFGGSEIDRSQVQQFVALLNRIAMVAHGGLVLISHPSLAGISTDTGLSGSTQWHNSVRARFYLKSIKSSNDQPDTNVREIVFMKNNYGPRSASIALRYQNGLFLPVEGTTFDAAAKVETTKNVFLMILKRFISENRRASASQGPTYAPKLFAEEQEARAELCTKEMLADAMRALLKVRYIELVPYGKPSKKHFQLVVNTRGAEDINPKEPEPM